MRKRVIVGVILAGSLLLGIIGINNNQAQNSILNKFQTTDTNLITNEVIEEIKPICDGKTVTSDCEIDNVSYSTYIYHPAVAEKSHTETVTTYKKEVVGYCTLCNDGTYSPSCATGRGACSHHGGVAEWNAPRYSNVPEYSTKTVVDTPAKEAYYEKIIK